MTDIGCVLYRKGAEPGTLTAQYCHSELGHGTGQATGGPLTGFAGRYRIRYFDDQGTEIADRELDIQKDGGSYRLRWIHNGAIRALGIGMETSEGLAAGWCNVYPDTTEE
ncbi:MAG: hypothetical protein EHM45_17780 [Desulfobacteraceae bacterium]|nr:MAG: hypothetical protein EHM45_17780 [Desulfobacteraceae bacterium]